MAAVERRFRAMASEVHLVLVDGPDDLGAEAHAHLDRLEWIWSRFLPESDVTRMNDRAGHAVTVATDTLTLLATMVEAWRVTAGRYDPTILPLLVAAGYGTSREDASRTTHLAEGVRAGGDLALVAIDPDASTVTLPPHTAVDPGGIGKGLAADLVVSHLLAAGAAGALVAIGGDLAMGGRPPEPAGWRVTIEGPSPTDRPLGTIAVSGGGVATSSTRSRRWEHAGLARHHVIDPGTGTDAATDLVAVTVVAPTGWLAEAHATAGLLAGSDRVLDHLSGHDLVGVAVTDDGRVLATPELDHLATPAGAR